MQAGLWVRVCTARKIPYTYYLIHALTRPYVLITRARTTTCQAQALARTNGTSTTKAVDGANHLTIA